MPAVKDSDLFKQLKTGVPSGGYYLYGPETTFSLAALRRLEQRTDTGSFDAFNRIRFDGAKLDMAELAEACDALPMMAAQKCIVIRDLNADRLSADELERLIGIVKELSENTVLIVCNTVEQFQPKKLSAKNKKLMDAFKKHGVLCEFERKDRAALKRALCERAAKQYISLDMAAADLLVERCGTDYATLINELDKLCAYVGSGEIAAQDIEACCVPSVEASAFELAKSILSGSYDRAFSIVDDLFALRQEPVAILGALSMAFADLYRAKCALSAGISADQTAADFAYPKNRLFAVKNARRDAARFSSAQIRRCVCVLCETDLALKSSRTPPRITLEQMLGEMRLAAARE